MRTPCRLPRSTLTLITLLCVGLPGIAGAEAKLNRKQLEAEAKTQFELWLQQTFTKCGETYFARARSYDFVYEIAQPTISFPSPPRVSRDELNSITTAAVYVRFSATKSRMSARPDTLLWDRGVRALTANGSEFVDLTFVRTNESWSVEPGSWYYERKVGPIACDQLPDSLRPTTISSATASPVSATPAESEPEAAVVPPISGVAADEAWYLFAAGSCEQQDPRSLLAMGKALGQSMTPRDVAERGRVVATTITAADGSMAQFYRGKARCEAALAKETGELDRYK